MEPHVSGDWFVSHTQYGPLVHAQLGVAEGNSGKLVTQVRRVGEKLAEEQNAAVILVDGPPGIGCQTTAALSGATLVVLVTEPSASGRHDMERLLAVTNRLGVPAVVVLNKADLAPGEETIIRNTASAMGAQFIGVVPFVQEIPSLLASCELLNSCPRVLADVAGGLWDHIWERAQQAERENG
jgi:MinD superfamily P-loop ATPase